nr:FeoA family protein [Levilactobacillus lanxiensis]
MIMQLRYSESAYPIVTVEQMATLDGQTAHRLHNLGIHPGSQLTVLRQYPFHGPVIVEFDQQKVGIRYVVFEALLGGH